MSADAVHFNVHEAKTHLSRIIERVERGEEEIVPLEHRVNRSGIGSLAGQVKLDDDWDSARTNAQIADDFGINT